MSQPEPSLYDEVLGLVPEYMHPASGEVFLSGRTSFEQPSSPIYVVGFNPGSSPESLPDWTIAYDLELARSDARRDWCGYVDESWAGLEPGTEKFQRRVQYLYEQCDLNPRLVPASNVIFVRSSTVATLDPKKAKDLVRDSWPVHQRIIDALDVRVVVCLGKDAGWWVREQLGATGEPVDSLPVPYTGRTFTCTTHVGRDGTRVVTLLHPSRGFNWDNPIADPTGLVVRALASQDEQLQECGLCGDTALCKWDDERDSWICDPCD